MRRRVKRVRELVIVTRHALHVVVTKDLGMMYITIGITVVLQTDLR